MKRSDGVEEFGKQNAEWHEAVERTITRSQPLQRELEEAAGRASVGTLVRSPEDWERLTDLLLRAASYMAEARPVSGGAEPTDPTAERRPST